MGIWIPGQPLPHFPCVVAEHFERGLHGRNRAVLLGCMGPNGGVTCVVKLHHRLENKTSYWVEWVAGLLAEKLGVATPEQFVVEIGPDMAAVLGEQLGEDATTSARPSFGTRYISSPVQFVNSRIPLDDDLRELGAEVVVLDVFIDNPDRRPTNPNLLIDARTPRRLVAIDHDLAFSSFLTPLIGGSTWPLDLLGAHALEGRFGTKKPTLARIRSAIEQLSDDFLDGLPEATPPVWLPGQELTKLQAVIQKLKQRRDDIDGWFPLVEGWL